MQLLILMFINKPTNHPTCVLFTLASICHAALFQPQPARPRYDNHRRVYLRVLLSTLTSSVPPWATYSSRFCRCHQIPLVVYTLIGMHGPPHRIVILLAEPPSLPSPPLPLLGRFRVTKNLMFFSGFGVIHFPYSVSILPGLSQGYQSSLPSDSS